MDKLTPLDLLVFAIFLNIANILFTDTSSVHEISTIPNSIFVTFLLILLLIVSIPLLWNAKSTNENIFLSGAILLSIGTTVLYILDFSFNLLGYRILLDLVAFLTISALYHVRSYEGRIYITLLFLTIIDLQTILFSSLSIKWLILSTRFFFELAFAAGLIYFIYIRETDNYQQTYLLGLSLISIGFASFILTKSTALLIIRTVIEQILGIGEFSIGIGPLKITKDTLFIIHILEFTVLSSVILFNRLAKTKLAIILCGFNLTFPPLIGFRALALMIYLNRSDASMNTFTLINRQLELHNS